MLEEILTRNGHVKTSFAGFMLSNVSQEWPNEISEKLKETYPWVEKYQSSVFLEEASVEGFSVGFVHVRPRGIPVSADSPESINIITIPVIIRDFQLAPLDIFSFKGRFFPLTEQRAERILRSTSSFEAPDRRRQEVSASENYGSPLDAGSFAVGLRSSPGYSSIPYAKISSGADLKDLIRYNLHNPTEYQAIDLQALSAAEHFDLASEMAKTAEERSEVLYMEFENALDSFQCRPVFSKTPLKEFKGPWEKISALEAQRYLKSDGFKSFVENGYYVLTNPDARGQAKISGKDCGHADGELTTEETDNLSSSVQWPPYPEGKSALVVFRWESTGEGDPPIENGTPVHNFVGSRTKTPSWGTVQYILLEDGTVLPIGKYVPKDPKPRPAGCCAPEVVLDAPQWTEGTGGGEALAHILPECIHIGPTLERIMAEGDLSLGGPDGCWEMGPHTVKVEAVPNPFAEDEVVAGEGSTNKESEGLGEDIYPNVKVSSLRSGGYRVNLYGAVPPDLDIQGVSRRDSLIKLATAGIHHTDAEWMLDKADTDGSASAETSFPKFSNAFDELRPVADAAFKVQEQDRRVVKKFKPGIDKTARRTWKNAVRASELCKQSAAMPNALDLITGMNFLSENTVRKFIEYIPAFQDVLSDVCCLLLASRLGLDELVERELEDTVRGLDSILGSLRRIDYSLDLA